MHVIAEVSVIPIGVGVHLSEYIAECQRVLKAAGLEMQLHANGTNVEGDWDTVMGAVRRCHERLHEMGAVRLVTNMKIATRSDRDQGLDDVVQRVRQRLD